MKTLSVLIDTREQRPFKFPPFYVSWDLESALGRTKPVTYRVDCKRQTLAAGDYALESWEDVILLERKSSLLEISKNILTPDRERFFRSLGRLADACEYPTLLIESVAFPQWMAPTMPAPAQMRRTAASGRLVDDSRALDVLLMTTTRLGIRVLWGMWRPTGPVARTRLAELALRVLLKTVEGRPPRP